MRCLERRRILNRLGGVALYYVCSGTQEIQFSPFYVLLFITFVNSFTEDGWIHVGEKSAFEIFESEPRSCQWTRGAAQTKQHISEQQHEDIHQDAGF